MTNVFETRFRMSDEVFIYHLKRPIKVTISEIRILDNHGDCSVVYCFYDQYPDHSEGCVYMTESEAIAEND